VHRTWAGRFALAWLFRIALPGVYRRTSARFDRVPRAVIHAARGRSRRD
jgi:hypothetical protein